MMDLGLDGELDGEETAVEPHTSKIEESEEETLEVDDGMDESPAAEAAEDEASIETDESKDESPVSEEVKDKDQEAEASKDESS